MLFEEALVTELSTINGLNNKIFPLNATQGTQVPFLVYELNNTDRILDFSGHNGLIEAGYEINIFHSTYSEMKTLVNLILAKLKTFQLRNIATTGTYVQKIEIINQVEGFDTETELYGTIIDIQVSYIE